MEHERINDLWEDMDRLNALYEEMMWAHDDELGFVADYQKDRIIIKRHSCLLYTSPSPRD